MQSTEEVNVIKNFIDGVVFNLDRIHKGQFESESVFIFEIFVLQFLNSL